MHVFTAQLAFSLHRDARLRQVVLSQHGHRLQPTLGCPVALAHVLRLDKALLAPQPRIASLRPIRPSFLAVFRRLLLCPINHVLLISGIFRNTCAIIANALALARATIPLASYSSACSVIALTSRSRLFWSFSASFESANSCALRL